jgi:predicted DNA-binding transcriptional regulator AlpA
MGLCRDPGGEWTWGQCPYWHEPEEACLARGFLTIKGIDTYRLGRIAFSVMTHHLIGVTEIAGMLGISRQRVDQLVRSGPFPDPEAELIGGRVWSHETVERWAKERLRPIDASGEHKAEPYELPTGKWIAYCTACGRIGIGPDFDSETLAIQLVAAHNSIYLPRSATMTPLEIFAQDLICPDCGLQGQRTEQVPIGGAIMQMIEGLNLTGCEGCRRVLAAQGGVPLAGINLNASS